MSGVVLQEERGSGPSDFDFFFCAFLVSFSGRVHVVTNNHKKQ